MSYCSSEKARSLLSYPGQRFLIQPLPEGTDQANRQGHTLSTDLWNTELLLPLQLSFNIFKHIRDFCYELDISRKENTTLTTQISFFPERFHCNWYVFSYEKQQA